MLERLLNACVGVVVLAAIFVPLERTHRARRQRHLRAGIALDLAFLTLQYLVMAAVLLALNGWLRASLAQLGPTALQHAVHALPLPAQVALAVVLGDFGLYWAHRLSHSVPFLWRYHAVHHTAETLDWVAAHREHPLDGMYRVVS